MELGAAVAHGVTNMNNLRSLWGGHLAELGGYSGSEADEWQRHGRVLFMVMLVVLVLVLGGCRDERQAEHLPELVSDRESLALQAAAWVAAIALAGLRNSCDGDSWNRTGEPMDFADYWLPIDEADVGRHLFVRGNHYYSDRACGSIGHWASLLESALCPSLFLSTYRG